MQSLRQKTLLLLSNNNHPQFVGNDINLSKAELAEKKRTNKWLAEQLGKAPGTVSKW